MIALTLVDSKIGGQLVLFSILSLCHCNHIIAFSQVSESLIHESHLLDDVILV